MTTTTKRLVALSLAMSVFLAAFVGGGAAVAPKIDTETGNTATTSEIQAGTTVGNFAANNSKMSTVSIQAQSPDTNDTQVSLIHNASGGAIVAQNASGVFISKTSSYSYHNHSFQHSELADLERGINDNVTVSIRTTNDTTNATLDQAFQGEFYVESTDAYSVQYVGDSDVSTGDIVEVTNESGFDVPAVDLTIGGEDKSEIDTDDRMVNNSTKVAVALGNGTVAEDFDRTVEDADSGDKLSRLFASERAVVLVTHDDGTMPVPVFYESAPDDFDTDRTYAVYESVGGTDSIVVYQGADLETDELAVRTLGSVDRTAFADDYLTQGLSLTIGATAGGVSILVSGLPLLATRTEPREWFRAGGDQNRGRGGA